MAEESTIVNEIVSVQERSTQNEMVTSVAPLTEVEIDALDEIISLLGIPNSENENIMRDLNVTAATNANSDNLITAIDRMLNEFLSTPSVNTIHSQRNLFIGSVETITVDTNIIHLMAGQNEMNMFKILYFLLNQVISHLNSKRGGFLDGALIHSLIITIIADCLRGDFGTLFDMIFN